MNALAQYQADRARTATALRFDGVFRPELWLGPEQWQAVAYERDGRMGKRMVNSRRDGAEGKHFFATEAEAQARCDELNRRKTL